MNALKLKHLSQEELIATQGGESKVSFTDPEGYQWTYYYNDAGELTHWCVIRSAYLL